MSYLHSISLSSKLIYYSPIFFVCIIIWLVLTLAVAIANKLGVIGINIVTRIMGLILAAMAVEFIARGLNGLFPKLFT